jgi:signal peptidase I
MEWVTLIITAFVIASVIQSELFALTEVNMSSMMNTLVEGDKLIMNKLAYSWGEPQHGDIIIFLRDEPVNGVIGRASIYVSDISKKLKKEFRRNRLIKRVIGVPGDEIEIRDNALYVNGQKQEEEYARIDPYENIVLNGSVNSFTVPEGKLFVLGDNRGESMDSRSFGVIDRSWVEGKAIFRILPFSKIGSIK